MTGPAQPFSTALHLTSTEPSLAQPTPAHITPDHTGPHRTTIPTYPTSPDGGKKIYSCNEGNSVNWDESIKSSVDYFKQNKYAPHKHSLMLSYWRASYWRAFYWRAS